MSKTWSNSALQRPAVPSAASFPPLSGGAATVPSCPPSKKPVTTLSLAERLKQSVEADKASVAANKPKVLSHGEIEAKRLVDRATERQMMAVRALYSKNRSSSDEDYSLEDARSDEMDYETSVEYAEHLRFNRKGRVEDYSKDLSDEEFLDYNGYDEHPI